MTIESAISNLMRGRRLSDVHKTLSGTEATALDRPAFLALSTLVANSPVRLSDLADLCGVDVSTMSRLVRRLASQSFIEASSSANDGRVMLLKPTEAGYQLIEDLKEIRCGVLARRLADWTAEEIADFALLLSRFTKSLATTEVPPA